MAGTSYTRQSTLTDGDTITASLFNAEYNQLVTAFSYAASGTTGHQHDGGAGEGGNIEIIGDQDFNNKIVVDSSNNRWSVYVEVGGSAVEQVRIEDGVVYPVTDSDVDLGTNALRFKDAYIDSLTATGNLTIGGNIDVDGIVEFDGLSGTGSVTVTDILDQDDMSGNSATALATQQSIKAYVDSQVTAQDLDLTDGSSSISIDLDSEALSVLGGTGIDSTASGNGVTLAIDSTVTTLTGSQTLTNKTLTSPDVNTPDIDGGTIDGTVIGGSSAAAGSFTTVGATGNITVGGTVDGRDVATDGTKLDGIEASATADQTNAEIRTAVEAATDSNVFTDADHTKLNAIEASADVTDTANVTAAGALMDSELTAIASVKALNQGVATTDSPTFAAVTVNGNVEFDGLSGTGSVTVTDILDQDDMSGNSATALATQQSIKAYVDAQQDTVDTLAEILALSNATGGTDIAVGTGDDITFADSSKAIFGAGSDLSIYHDGSNSYIDESGTGSLYLKATNLTLGDSAGEQYVVAYSGGSVNLYHDNAQKLATTSGGILVTGEVAATSLDISGDIDVDGTTNLDVVDIDGAVDMASTLAVGGVVTANAGVVVDNITIDGNEIDVGSGDLTLDVAGNINLDADGANVYFNDGGTERYRFKLDATPEINVTGGTFAFKNNTSDADILFSGNDGGSAITALTLDMSAAGAATFNAGVTAVSGVFKNAADATGTTIKVQDNADRGITITSPISNGAAAGRIATSGTANSLEVGVRDYPTALTIAGGSGAATFSGDVSVPNINVADDIRHTGDSDTYISFEANNQTYYSGGTRALDLASGSAVFNEGGGDMDFRVESSGNAHALFVNGENGRTGVGVANPQASLDVASRFLANHNDGHAEVTIVSTSNRQPSLTFKEGTSTRATLFTAAGSNDLTLDVAGDIILDADGAQVRFKDAGTEFFKVSNESGFVQLYSPVSNSDIKFDGNDGGSAITALTLDMSAAGAATFNSSVTSTGLTVDTGSTFAVSATLGHTGGSQLIFLNDDGGSRNQIDSQKNSASADLDLATGGTARFKIAADGSLSTPTAGTSNVRFGVNAGNSIVSGGNYNVVVGDEAGTAITTGDNNVAIGYATMRDNTTGGDNTALGFASLIVNTTGQSNTSVGFRSLYANTTASNNTALGYEALKANTTGTANAAMGGTTLTTNTTGSYNSGFGRDSLGLNTTGSNNTAVGESALYANTTASNNTAVGKSALVANTTGADNVAVGYTASDAITGGSNNVSVGLAALTSDTLGNKSVAIGNYSLAYQNFTSATDTYNTAVGYQAGNRVTTGQYNTLIGSLAGDAITTGSSNAALGYNSLGLNTTGARNVAMGAESLSANTTGADNVAIGEDALTANTTASNNTAVGTDALATNTTADGNTAIGKSALVSNTTGPSNVAVGFSSLQGNTTGISNSAFGTYVLKDNTTGNYNTALGGDIPGGTYGSLSANTTGSSNVAVGTAALRSNTTASNNTAVGYRALDLNTTGTRNVAVGALALDACTTGSQNTGVGADALSTLTTGVYNVAVGDDALGAVTTSNRNTGIGLAAGREITTGAFNTVLGSAAMGGATTITGSDNIAIGSWHDGVIEGPLAAVSSGGLNTAIGNGCLRALTTASHNHAIGYSALSAVTTGDGNVALGYQAGDVITTGTGNTAIGNMADCGGGAAVNRIALGNQVNCASNNRISVGQGTQIASLELNGSDTSWAASSDERLKENVVASTAGLSFINDLRPVTYNWKKAKDIPSDLPQYIEGSSDPCLGATYGTQLHGFIAQEVKTVLDNHPEVKDGQGVWQTDETSVQTLAPAALVPMLVKAIQEQNALIESLTARIETLEG